jgi:23S rRNA (adenine2503-C2)-methyltransferase
MSTALPTNTAPSFFGMSRDRLRRHVEGLGVPAYRAEQMYAWVYQKHVRDPLGMTNLPATLRQSLPGICDFALPSTASVHRSPDGNTYKFVFELSGGARVESVSMRTSKRLTFCISSQVGCALKCAFCATGLMGLIRNLKAHEIVAQVMAMGDFHGWHDERFNIVYMGMGEPLANLPAVAESLRILNDDHGLNLGARRITVSTSGLVPQIRELAALDLQVGLAVSLHATTDDVRDELVPVNKRWPIRELIDAAKEYGRTVGRRVTLEYTLMAGVNDGLEDADRLAAFARELPSKVNIIPYNPVPGLPWKRPTPEAIERFAARLYPQSPAVTVRHTQGGDIWAACGQLGGLSPQG